MQHFIDGQFTDGVARLTFPVLNPEDDRVVSECSDATQADVDKAVSAALRASVELRSTSVTDRESRLIRAATKLDRHRDRLVQQLIDETGSPISKAHREIETAIRLLNAAAGAARHVTGQTFASEDPLRTSFSVREPVGVVAGFTPFNVPLIKSVKHTAMALATGNAVVLMPSEQAPGVSLTLAEAYHESGWPPGSVNVVCGGSPDVRNHLTRHPEIGFVGFTGSLAVGSIIAQLCGNMRKRYTLEMGGQNPLIVLQDADVPAAVAAAVPGCFLYQGQICMSSSRLIVHQSVASDFTERLVHISQQLVTDDLTDPKTMIGPIIHSKARSRIRACLKDALDRGATLLTGNHWQGNRLMPTLLTNVDSSMDIWRTEVFGPVSTIHVVETEQQALALANDSRYGLTASVFTNQLSTALTFSKHLQAGMVHVNEGTILEEAHVPFGGIKDSGPGREGTMATIDDLTEWKWITLRSSTDEQPRLRDISRRER